MSNQQSIPLIDFSSLHQPALKGAHAEVARQLRSTCTQHGFFYVKGHGISIELQNELEDMSRAFFALPEQEKMQISMQKGGKAWRGFFPVGGELTSGIPDEKEGIYLGQELTDNHPLVKANLPMHGQNLFPAKPEKFKETILAFIKAMEELGHLIMRSVSLSLNLQEDYFSEHYTKDPLVLFRIFHYPPSENSATWGVGEHTDYGLLTILKQDNAGGLQVKSKGQWIEAPPIENTFVCNIGDMLELITNGFYKSTPHRVKNVSGKSRFSFPVFFDPGFLAPLRPIKGLPSVHSSADQRWDGEDVLQFRGNYGDYLLKKVGKAFPDLQKQVL